ncbi:hypothetical protein ABWJ92_32370 [Streptomyces sp. NPDC000609]|uniref:hypothetical protein n=1 Tax=Streptomyces sp. NPDC000609 TaxID=3160957 RepID=UPI003390FD9E
MKSVVGGPSATSFSTSFTAVDDQIEVQRVRPSNLFAAEAATWGTTEQLIRGADYAPAFVGDLDSGARLVEDSSALTRAQAGQLRRYCVRGSRPRAVTP